MQQKRGLMMKTLYLHIGTPKTGTTAIQIFCRDNQSTLNSYGYCYPESVHQYPNIGIWRNGHFLVGKIHDEDGKRDFAREDAIFEEGFLQIYKLFEQYDNVILSDEGIWHHGIREGSKFLEKLQKELKKGIFTIKIIVYLRRQDDFLYSWWNQQIKEGMLKVSVFDWERMVNELLNIRLDYHGVLQQFADVVGKDNIIVRRFDRKKFFGGTIYADFLNAMGLQYSDEYQVLSEIQNISLTKNDNEIKRILNNIPELDVKSNQVFRTILLDCSKSAPDDSQYGMFSKEEAEEFLSKYEEENSRVVREYLGTEEELFDKGYKMQEKWSPDNPEMLESVIRFVGRLAIYQISEQEKLKKENAELKKMLQKHENWINRMKNIVKHPVKTAYRKTKNALKKEN